MWKFIAYLTEPRAVLYEVTATLFSFPPAQETLPSLQQQVAAQEEQMDFWDDEVVASAAKELCLALSAGEDLADLRADHQRLFLWTTKDGTWASERNFTDPASRRSVARDVSSAYAEAGFHKASWFTGPDDHVALECLFMASMSRSFITMAQDMAMNPSTYVTHLERQHGFLAHHMLQWIPPWDEHVRAHGETRLYRAAARLTRRLVETDHKKLPNYVKLIRGCGYGNCRGTGFASIPEWGKPRPGDSH
jgi:TorA maturation chaperone TorD